MDGVALRGLDRAAVVDRLADDVHDATERRLSDRDADALAGVPHLLTTGEPVRRVHGDAPHGLLAEVQRHLDHQVPRLVVDGRVGDPERVEDGGQGAVGELDVDDGSDHLRDASYARHDATILSALPRPRRSP
jgi:hypothetical protein